MTIATAGMGISGLVVADRLHREHDLTRFEAADYVGGRTHTVDVERAREAHAVDTGLIVFNSRTYPRFCRPRDDLGAASQPTEMSFGIGCAHTGLEHNRHTLNTRFAQRRNLVNPGFLHMVWEILRLNLAAPGPQPIATLEARLG